MQNILYELSFPISQEAPSWRKFNRFSLYFFRHPKVLLLNHAVSERRRVVLRFQYCWEGRQSESFNWHRTRRKPWLPKSTLWIADKVRNRSANNPLPLNKVPLGRGDPRLRIRKVLRQQRVQGHQDVPSDIFEPQYFKYSLQANKSRKQRLRWLGTHFWKLTLLHCVCG